MIDILLLRSRITGLLPNAGLYKLPQSSNRPAICVLPDPKYGYSYPPDEIMVTGVEVAIIVPPIETKPLLSQDILRSNKANIYLKYWDGNITLNTHTINLVNGLQDFGYRFESPVFIPALKKIGSPPTVLIQILDSEVRIAEQ